MYPDSVNRIKELKMDSREGRYPGAERIAKTLLTLPTHILLKDKNKNESLCHIVKEDEIIATRTGEQFK